ncbi:hypothetical protein J1N10_16870 [Carboxylicivirga sp. A043]|uniref:hypothetical protein n=1 Tax=Carboxylicivirga litoralis TaxID=2816963 RepID=UPI0021CAE5DA|nr:hypothetical protein [Carboxylicivirga sp. A043]MCU4157652.1 hypothetical protein [Carboxylicivirga sp. A043]
MKNLIYALLFCFVALSSCDQDNIQTKFDAGGVDYVAVGVTAVDAPYKLNADNSYSISFPIHRTLKNVSGTEANLVLNSSNGSGLFELESQNLTFEQGSALAYAKIIATDPGAIDPATVYSFELVVSGDNASPLYNTAVFSGQLELNFEMLGTGSFASTWDEETRDVNLYKAIGLDIYMAEALYEAGFDVLIIANEGAATVSIPEQKGWFHTGVELPVRIAGTGTISNNNEGKKVFTMQIEHYLPEYDHTWGAWDEVITFP